MDAPLRPPAGHPPRRRSPRDRTRGPTSAGITAGLVVVATLAATAATPPPLDMPISAAWRAVPLREWAGRVATVAGRPVVVDRRLDPDTTVSRDCRDEPLGDVLDDVVAGAGGAIEILPAWIRIVPRPAAGRAAAGERERAAEVARLPAAARAALAVRSASSWADGGRPRDIVAATAAEAGVDLTGIDRVPHDHLPGASLPPLGLADRLDIVLAHYDLRVSWAGGTTPRGSIVPLPAAAAAPAIAAGPRPGRGGQPRQKPGGTDRFTLRLEAPLDEAIAAIAPRLGLEAAIDRESLAARGILPGEIVRAAVADATREELLDAIVGPLGLRWRIEGRRLVIDAAR